LENVEYEPEQFPGVIYRPPEIGTVNLIFASGKTIISGTIHDEEAKESVENLRQQLASIPT
jgi:transcription initiation factor TFIID TATA-box-binding protein